MLSIDDGQANVPGLVSGIGYDLQKDPQELTNLALVKKHGPRLGKMRDRTIVELKRTKAGFVDNLPPTGTDKRAR